jgi:hypothetical protein
MQACRSCGAAIRWAEMPTGARMPLDDDEAMLMAGVVAFNPETGGGHVVRETELETAGEWRTRGVTFHVSHFATCPNAQQHRRRSVNA